MAIGIYIRILSLKGNIIHEMSVKENETRYFIFYFFSSNKKKKHVPAYENCITLRRNCVLRKQAKKAREK